MTAVKKSIIHGLIIRVVRLSRHLLFPVKDQFLRSLINRRKTGLFLVHYIVEIPMLVLDIFGLPEFISFFQFLFKGNSRMLHDHELQLAIHIFRNRFDIYKTRIDEKSRFGTRGGKLAFVAFYYINCQGKLSLPVLIHELAHVLQYEQNGSRYAFRNMIAHLIPPTYDYGGLKKIEDILHDPDTIHALNYEQRAEIFSDYYLLLSGCLPEWGSATSTNLGQYYQVIQFLIA